MSDDVNLPPFKSPEKALTNRSFKSFFQTEESQNEIGISPIGDDPVPKFLNNIERKYLLKQSPTSRVQYLNAMAMNTPDKLQKKVSKRMQFYEDPIMEIPSPSPVLQLDGTKLDVDRLRSVTPLTLSKMDSTPSGKNSANNVDGLITENNSSPMSKIKNFLKGKTFRRTDTEKTDKTIDKSERDRSIVEKGDVSNTSIMKRRDGVVRSFTAFFSSKEKKAPTGPNYKNLMFLSEKQYDLISDKITVQKQSYNRQGNKKRVAQVRQPKQMPRFKQLLQKHQLIKEDLKADFVKELLARVRAKKRGFFFRFIDYVVKQFKKLKNVYPVMKDVVHNLAIPASPHGRPKFIWDMLCFILIIYELGFIPFQIGFEFDPQGGLEGFEIAKDGFFIIDVLLMFHTAYIQEGNYITSHKKIAHHYLKGWFAFDLVGSLPYRTMLYIEDMVQGDSDSLDKVFRYLRIILLIRIVKLFRLRTLWTKARDISHSQVTTGVISLLSILIENKI